MQIDGHVVETLVDVRGLAEVLASFEIPVQSRTPLVVYIVPFLAEPASQFVSILAYPMPTSPASHWFLPSVQRQYQALVIKKRDGSGRHIVPVERAKPGVQEVTRDVLYGIYSQCVNEAVKPGLVVIHEVAAKPKDAYSGYFNVQQCLFQWRVGLSQDGDGPYYTVLASRTGRGEQYVSAL